MSEADRIKWNQRYAEESYNKNNPVTLLQQWLPRAPRGKALDVACGAGRNSIFLAEAGYRVDAIDISAEGLKQARQIAAERGLEINWIEHDLDQPFSFDRDYDLIVVMWYLDLALIEHLSGCLAAGGYLVCEEHLVTDRQVIGPSSTNFRVSSGQLGNAVGKLEILHYEESVSAVDDGEQVASARVVARNG